MFATLTETEKQIKAIVEYLERCHDGQLVSYVQVEAGTGVPMPVGPNRRLLHRAARRLDRVLDIQPGYGFVIDSPDNGAEIVNCRGRRAARAEGRHLRVAIQMLRKHGERMTPYDQRNVAAAVSLGGAIKSMHKEHARNRKASKPLDNYASPVLPKRRTAA